MVLIDRINDGADLAEHVEDARVFPELGAHFFVAVIDFEDAA